MSILLWPEGAPFATGTDTESPFMNLYLLEDGEPHPCVIVCPGGGYHMLADHEGEPIAKWLNQIGISAVVLNYRLAPFAHAYTPMVDAQRAIRLLRFNAKEWNIDPQKIGILGFSAGGHLASTAGTHYDLGTPAAEDPIERESSKPDLMVLCYAGISNIEFPPSSHLLGENPTEEMKLFFSSEKQVTPDTPPAFIWITATDQAVSAEHNLLFASALGKNNVPYELHVFGSGNHGLGLAVDNPIVKKWTSLCETWLRTQGF